MTRCIVRRATSIWETPVIRVSSLLAFLLALSALPTQAAIIDFTTGTVECTTAVLDPFTNYRDQGVTITNNFWVPAGGDNVMCPAGYPAAFRPALPWPSGIRSFLGYASISATSEIVRIEASGLGPRTDDGFGELCAVSGVGFPSPTSCDSPLAIKKPSGATAFNLSGLGWTNVALVGTSGFPITIREIETVPEPTSVVLSGLGLAALAARRNWRRRS